MSFNEITHISGLEIIPCPYPFFKARVTAKTDIMTFKRGIKDDSILLLRLLYESGETTGVVFDDLCYSTFEKVQVGNVYLFAGFQAEYTLLNNCYHIKFHWNTVFELSADVPDIPRKRFNFVSLREISNMPDSTDVVTIAICAKLGHLEERGGYRIREIVLLDSNEDQVILNLWNQAAINFAGQDGDVILVIGARVKEHNDMKNLNVDWFSYMEINPNIPESKKLSTWFQETKLTKQHISILEITPLHFRSIRARVTTKTDIIPYKYPCGSKDGKVFLLGLLDESGEIAGVVFDELCDSTFEKVQVGHVYLFSNFGVMKALEEYKILINPFQIQFHWNTVVELCADVPDIPAIRFNFVSLSKISNMPNLMPVDTIAICAEVGLLEERGKTRGEDKGYPIREIVLLDSNEDRVILNLWNKVAINFAGQDGDVILVKGARWKVDNGKKNLNVGWFSYMEINPNIPESKNLSTWWNQLTKPTKTATSSPLTPPPSDLESAETTCMQ